MRQQYSNILKKTFHQHLLRSRVDLGITQEEMAFRLAMANRTYIELDHGKAGCSALTLVLYLIYICADPLAFLGELKNAFQDIADKVA